MNYPIQIISAQSPDTLEVRWDPNNTCNFACRYCFPESNANTHKTTEDIDLLINNFDHMFTEYSQQLAKKSFNLIIGGGEPTLWKNFGIFLRKIKLRPNVYTTVISNASRTLRWWQDYGVYIDVATLSLHVGQSDIDHHISVADILYERGKKVTVLVLMDPDKWDQCVDAIEYMKQKSKYPWFIEAKTVVSTSALSVTYSAQQEKYLQQEVKRIPDLVWFFKNYKLVINGMIKKYRSKAIMDNGKTLKATASTYINKNYMRFTGWSCNIGLESVYISWTGDIQGACGQRILNSNNILDPDFTKKFKPNMQASICQMPLCNCLPETHVSKIKLHRRLSL